MKEQQESKKVYQQNRAYFEWMGVSEEKYLEDTMKYYLLKLKFEQTNKEKDRLAFMDNWYQMTHRYNFPKEQYDLGVWGSYKEYQESMYEVKQMADMWVDKINRLMNISGLDAQEVMKAINGEIRPDAKKKFSRAAKFQWQAILKTEVKGWEEYVLKKRNPAVETAGTYTLPS